MAEGIADDFLRLTVLDDSNDAKREQYHRILDTALALVEVAHEKLIGNNRTPQLQDAMILFQMALAKGMAIASLIEGYQYVNSVNQQVSGNIIDPTVIAALTRTQMEAFAVFHNIYNSSNNQDVIDLLHDVWVVAGLNERQKGGFSPTNKEHKAKAEKEKKQIEELMGKIKNNPIFQSQPAERQPKILEWISARRFEIAYRNKQLVLLKQKEMFMNSGINEAFSNQYAVLSWFIHPSNVSVFQFAQMFEMNFNVQSAYTLMNVSRILISMLVVEYCKYVPGMLEAFEKLPKLNQLLIYTDNKTYRRQNEFPINIFKEFESEIAKKLNLKKDH